MFEPLIPHKQYIHVWDIFSRLLLLDATREKNTSLIHIWATQAWEKKYQILAADRKIPYFPLRTYYDLTSVQSETWKIFSLLIADMQLNINPQLVAKETLIQVGQHISIQDTAKILLDLWFAFHEYDKESSFHSSGDILNIMSPQGEKITLSFWGDEIEIISFHWGKVNSIRLWSLQKFEEEKTHKDSCTLLEYLKKSHIHIILDMLEFHHLYEILSSHEYNASSFNILWNEKTAWSVIDLKISDLLINNIEDLRSVLQDTSKNITLYTQYENMLW
jgi:hypothetical protein